MHHPLRTHPAARLWPVAATALLSCLAAALLPALAAGTADRAEPGWAQAPETPQALYRQ